jgi:hypothetical protein
MPDKSLNNRTVSPNAAKQAIRKCINVKRPVFIWGPPGIGKSDIVKQIGESQNRQVIDIRLSLWDPTDIKGIPFYNPNANGMSWAPPVELPSDPNSNAILFLDELNSAAPATQAAAFQLVLNRRVGTYVLPSNVSIVAAGNRDSDKGVTYRMPSPLANRFIHLELKVDFDDWLNWATLNHEHEQVVGYVGFAKGDLYDFDPKGASRAFATPRSWHFVSELLKDDDLDENTLTDLISGAIGEGLAVKFMAHRKIAKQMPNPIDILKGKVTSFNIKEISAMYSLNISMCYELKAAYERKDPDINQQIDNFFAFILNNFPAELSIVGVKIALTNYNLSIDISKLKNFDEFQRRYGKHIITAMQM